MSDKNASATATAATTAGDSCDKHKFEDTPSKAAQESTRGRMGPATKGTTTCATTSAITRSKSRLAEQTQASSSSGGPSGAPESDQARMERYRAERNTARDEVAVLSQTLTEIVQEKDATIEHLQQQLQALSAQLEQAQKKVTVLKRPETPQATPSKPPPAATEQPAARPVSQPSKPKSEAVKRTDTMASKIRSFAAVVAATKQSKRLDSDVDQATHRKDIMQLLARTSTFAAATRRQHAAEQAPHLVRVAIRGLDARRIAAVLSGASRTKKPQSSQTINNAPGRRAAGPFVTKGGIRDVLRFLGVPTQYVLDIETIGRSVIELYLLSEHLEEVRESLRSFSGPQSYEIISEYDPTLPVGRMSSTDALQHYLDRMERILWTGRPLMRAYARLQLQQYKPSNMKQDAPSGPSINV